MNGETLLWVVFGAVLLVMAALDLGLLQREPRAPTVRQAAGWTAIWFLVASLFGAGIWLRLGSGKALEFYTGYLVELSLSADNVFVFLMLFTYFRVPAAYQHKVLFWGILGALLMRAVFIAAGVTLIQRFQWVVIVFGVFLVVMGLRMAFQRDKELHPEKNPVLRLARWLLPVTTQFDGDRFLTRVDGRRVATPLLVALILVETTDVMFAFDSIPAILAITRDPFIVYTSNIFAILGLRALYFALAGFMGVFRYLDRGIAAILVFVGVKMLAGESVPVPTAVSLAIIVLILTTAVAVSLLHRPPPETPPA